MKRPRLREASLSSTYLPFSFADPECWVIHSPEQACKVTEVRAGDSREELPPPCPVEDAGLGGGEKEKM